MSLMTNAARNTPKARSRGLGVLDGPDKVTRARGSSVQGLRFRALPGLKKVLHELSKGLRSRLVHPDARSQVAAHLHAKRLQGNTMFKHSMTPNIEGFRMNEITDSQSGWGLCRDLLRAQYRVRKAAFIIQYLPLQHFLRASDAAMGALRTVPWVRYG